MSLKTIKCAVCNKNLAEFQLRKHVKYENRLDKHFKYSYCLKCLKKVLA